MNLGETIDRVNLDMTATCIDGRAYTLQKVRTRQTGFQREPSSSKLTLRVFQDVVNWWWPWCDQLADRWQSR